MAVASGVRHLNELLSLKQTIVRVDLAKANLLCVNLMCEKLGEPCVCRLSQVLETCAKLQASSVNQLSLEGNNLRAVPNAVYLFTSLESLNLKSNPLANPDNAKEEAFQNLPKLKEVLV